MLVMSWNVFASLFNEQRFKSIISHIVYCNPDVICIQESSPVLEMNIPSRYDKIVATRTHKGFVSIYVKRGCEFSQSRVESKGVVSVVVNGVKIVTCHLEKLNGVDIRTMNCHIYKNLPTEDFGITRSIPTIVVGDFNTCCKLEIDGMLEYPICAGWKSMSSNILKCYDRIFSSTEITNKISANHSLQSFELSDHLPILINVNLP